jgi:Domain of unknown function (DUF3331)
MFDLGNADRWQRTLSVLSLVSSSSDASGSKPRLKIAVPSGVRVGSLQPAPPCLANAQAATGTRVVKVVERRSSKTVAVCWRDATSGHYAEQVWTLGVARTRAVCALTGAPIARGDAIYRPRHCRTHVPVNAEAAILASTLPRDPA